MEENTTKTYDRHAALAKRAERARDAEKALKEHNEAILARRAKTSRLRELRLAQQPDSSSSEELAPSARRKLRKRVRKY